MDRSTDGAPEGSVATPRRPTDEERERKRRERTEGERVAKARIIACIVDSTDTDPERNTLTRLFSRLESYIPRSTLHKYLKKLVELHWLLVEDDEIRSKNNQPMKVVRYVINPVHADMARHMADSMRSRPPL